MKAPVGAYSHTVYLLIYSINDNCFWRQTSWSQDQYGLHFTVQNPTNSNLFMTAGDFPQKRLICEIPPPSPQPPKKICILDVTV